MSNPQTSSPPIPAKRVIAMINQHDKAISLLRRIYEENGPRYPGGKVLVPSRYAYKSKRWVDKHYDFPGRHLMQEIAKVIAEDNIRKRYKS